MAEVNRPDQYFVDRIEELVARSFEQWEDIYNANDWREYE